MAVLQTQKIHICALKSKRKDILEDLQRLGCVQIQPGTEEDEVFRRMDTASEKNVFEKRAQSAEAALKVLDEYAPEKKGMLASLEGKRVITAVQYEDHVKDNEHALNEVRRIMAFQKKVGEARAGYARAEAAIESLTPWMTLDVPLNYKGTEKTRALIGALPGKWTAEQIMEAVGAAQPQLNEYDLEIVGSDKDQTCIFAVCSKGSTADMLEDALRVSGFVPPTVQSDLVPAAYAVELKGDRAHEHDAEQDAIEGIRHLSSSREDIRFAADYYRMRAEKYQVLGEILQSGHVFFIDGYVPKVRAEKIKRKLEMEYSCQVELEDIPQDEEAPVILKNNAFTAPTEGVVESFGLPAKGEIDPTTIMAFFYYFLFGLMLSDAGYGILMVIGCAVVLKKFPNMEAGIRKMIQMFFYCGISTTIWGILFGGYFGDVVTVVSETFFHHRVEIPALWFVPLDDPMKLLLFSFLFGIIHLFVGLGIKGYMLLKANAYMDFFSNVICWYLLLLGLILMLIPSEIFASMAGAVVVFPAWLNVTAKWMAIVGAVGILLFSKSGTKNPGLRVALGAYELYGVSSWLSDVLSYSRLLALGLATGVIATVINTMGGMLGGLGAIGFILFWMVFLVGHTLNMAINLLGAYVHTNRLQFVEFFGKFYEGGGKAFRPFSTVQNKYYKFKEED